MERDWSNLLEDIRYLKGRLDTEGDSGFSWGVGESYKDEHTIDLYGLAVRATTKKLYDGDKIAILVYLSTDLIREPIATRVINSGVLEELDYFLANN